MLDKNKAGKSSKKYDRETMEHTAFLVSEMYMDLLPELETLPDLLELLIENYDLDCTKFSRAQIIDLGNAHNIVFSVLKTVQNSLWTYLEKVKETDYKKTVLECEKAIRESENGYKATA